MNDISEVRLSIFKGVVEFSSLNEMCVPTCFRTHDFQIVFVGLGWVFACEPERPSVCFLWFSSGWGELASASFTIIVAGPVANLGSVGAIYFQFAGKSDLGQTIWRSCWLSCWLRFSFISILTCFQWLAVIVMFLVETRQRSDWKLIEYMQRKLGLGQWRGSLISSRL